MLWPNGKAGLNEVEFFFSLDYLLENIRSVEESDDVCARDDELSLCTRWTSR